MTIRPTLEDAMDFAQNPAYRILPLSCELFADEITPIEALRRLQAVSRHCYMLESAENNQKWGRYTFLGYDPKLELTCTDGVVRVTREGQTATQTATLKAIIRRLLVEHRSPRFPHNPPFTGALVASFSFDALNYAEPTLTLYAEGQQHLLDVAFMLVAM